MAKSKYYNGIQRRKFEDINGREILDPNPVRNAVQDARSISDLKNVLFVNLRVSDDVEGEHDEHIEDVDPEEFQQPGLGRYEEFAEKFDNQSALIRETRRKELESEQKLKREKYERAQRNAAKKKYGLSDLPEPKAPPENDPSDSET